MKIFLDTASLPEIVWAAGAGLIDGVTTNPSLLAQEDSETDPRDHLTEIARSVSGPVGAEVVAVDAEGMYREGRDLAKVADSIIVMVPMLEDGIVATRRLTSEGIRVCTTLVFTPAQALLAAKSGARSGGSADTASGPRSPPNPPPPRTKIEKTLSNTGWPLPSVVDASTTTSAPLPLS